MAPTAPPIAPPYRPIELRAIVGLDVAAWATVLSPGAVTPVVGDAASLGEPVDDARAGRVYVPDSTGRMGRAEMNADSDAAAAVPDTVICPPEASVVVITPPCTRMDAALTSAEDFATMAADDIDAMARSGASVERGLSVPCTARRDAITYSVRREQPRHFRSTQRASRRQLVLHPG
jgi:hypothetical protein